MWPQFLQRQRWIEPALVCRNECFTTRGWYCLEHVVSGQGGRWGRVFGMPQHPEARLRAGAAGMRVRVGFGSNARCGLRLRTASNS